MVAMTFGATSSPCLAQTVKNMNAEEFRQRNPEAVNAIINNHYVDDYLDSCNNENDAVKLIKDVVEIHKKGGFTICNCTCNSKTVLQEIPEELRSVKTKDLDLDKDLPNERILGLQCNPNEDYFYFNCKLENVDEDLLNGKRIPTKREVLKVEASTFDPLGFIAPCIVKAKILLQDIWRSGIGWDEKINDSLYLKWKRWIEDLKSISEVKIPRCYAQKIENAKSIQLHIFTDASEQAFDAVAYLRVDTGQDIQVSFIMARTRVAPLNPISMLRLEVQGTVLGTRIAKIIVDEHELKIQKVHFWCDSTTVLGWIKSDARKYKTFVAHRIGEILENSEIWDCHYVDTKNNVADEATRDIQPCDFTPGCRWLNGSEFLKLPEEDWPKQECKLKKNQAEEEEMKTEFINVMIMNRQKALDFSRFSSLRRLTRTVAWILRFKNRCLKQITNENEFTDQELTAAQIVLLKWSQVESFTEEIYFLKKNKPIPNTSRIIKLSPMINEVGLLCMRSRIEKSTAIEEVVKTPIILDNKHCLTQLLIDDYHRQAYHVGQERVVNDLRQRYWILNVRTAVRSAWNRCLVCKLRRAEPHPPEMGLLPLTVKKNQEKRYGVLFTCLSTRAIHLEIAANLSTDSTIMAIRRFVGRRGKPEKLYSDNGTNFRGADNELRKSLTEFNQDQIMREMSCRGIEWVFIPPSAPHMGGAWERLIRSVKDVLKIVLKERAPREEVLHTRFVEAENTVNNHPLTFVSVYPDDEESLTPNNFLLGASNWSKTPGIFSKTDLCLRKQWRISQKLADNFWTRWVKEYLPSLARRTKWHKKVEPLKIGNLVIIADGNLERNSWPRGIVVAVHPGKDGQMRVADIKTQTGIMRRPVSKLCVLDINHEVEQSSTIVHERKDVLRCYVGGFELNRSPT